VKPVEAKEEVFVTTPQKEMSKKENALKRSLGMSKDLANK
jgi:hypothetical protein